MLEIRKTYYIGGNGYEAYNFDINKCDICINNLKFIDINKLNEYLAVEQYEVEYDEDGDVIDEDFITGSYYISPEILAKYLGINKYVVHRLIEYNTLNKSPYSNSFYNSNDIDWNYKPEGSIRISDHWSFESYGNIHCVIDFENGEDEYDQEELNHSWLVCQFRNGKYHILERL